MKQEEREAYNAALVDISNLIDGIPEADLYDAMPVEVKQKVQAAIMSLFQNVDTPANTEELERESFLSTIDQFLTQTYSESLAQVECMDIPPELKSKLKVFLIKLHDVASELTPNCCLIVSVPGSNRTVLLLNVNNEERLIFAKVLSGTLDGLLHQLIR